MEKTKELLQLFAEAEMQETGEMTADAGQNEISAETAAENRRMSWDEIMADEEYKKEFDTQVQSIIQKRLRGRQMAEERLGRIEPILAALSERYGEGADIAEMDVQEIAEAILSGATRSQREQREAEIYAHLERMAFQEAEMRARYPGFDLSAEMENERFVRLTAPHTGLSLEDAYCAMHYGEIKEQEAQRSMKNLRDAIISGRGRPREIDGKQAASRTYSDPKAMTKEQREALKKRIYEAKAQGKKLPYGG